MFFSQGQAVIDFDPYFHFYNLRVAQSPHAKADSLGNRFPSPWLTLILKIPARFVICDQLRPL